MQESGKVTQKEGLHQVSSSDTINATQIANDKHNSGNVSGLIAKFQSKEPLIAKNEPNKDMKNIDNLIDKGNISEKKFNDLVSFFESLTGENLSDKNSSGNVSENQPVENLNAPVTKLKKSDIDMKEIHRIVNSFDTTDQTFRDLAAKNHPLINEALAGCFFLPDDVMNGKDDVNGKHIDGLADSKDKKVQIALAENGTVSFEAMDKLMALNDPDINKALAENITTPKEILLKLYNTGNEAVQETVQKNSNWAD
jgi:hypothetical protein